MQGLKSLMIGALLGLIMGAGIMLASPAEAGPVGGGHPYYTEEEIEAIHSGTASEIYVTVLEQDGDLWTYVKNSRTGGYYKAVN